MLTFEPGGALGAVTAQASGEARRRAVVTGIAVDAADAGAAILGARAGYLSRGSGTLLAVPAIIAAGMGVVGLQADQRPATGD